MAVRKNRVPDKQNWRESIPEDRLAHLIKDARRAMERGLQIRLIEHSVAFGHWTFLRILWAHDGLTQSELSELSGMSAPTTYSAINAMESIGYVGRSQKEGNKKNVYIHLTEKGKALQEYLLPLAEEVNAIAIKGLNKEEVRIARKVLANIVDNLVADEQQLQATGNRRVPSTRELGRLFQLDR